MASGQTTNFGLNQWAAEDPVLRTDFNQDNAKLDAALAGKAEAADLTALASEMLHISHGTYTGTGEAAQIHYSVGCRPKALIVTSHNYYSALDPAVRLLFAVDSLDIRITSDNKISMTFNDIASFDEDGFILDHSHGNVNLGLNREGYQQDYWVLY